MLTASSPAAYKLLHDGVQALSRAEHNGIRIDVDYLERTQKQTSSRIRDIEADMKRSPLGKKWRRRYGSETNFGSGTQLSTILRNEGHELPQTENSKKYAEGDKRIRYKTDVEAIEKVDDPFIVLYLENEKLKKVSGTFLKGIQRELIDDRVHVSFNLHTTKTYRSSSSNFNFQNLPIRDPEQGKLIRQCFIPSPGNRLIEVDFGGIEVCIAACYHKDPRMISYITDPSKDMHRDMAAQCFKMPTKEVTKMARYGGKNMFVFPQFYGDYFVSCAGQLWDYMQRAKLHYKSSEDRLIIDELARQGITERGLCTPGKPTMPGSFEDHIRGVEKHFWDKRFRTYRDWKKTWFAEYQKTGSFETKTGFRLEANISRNDVINWPVQGSAFHCLLQCFIWIMRAIAKRRMRTLLVGQIHDSIVADVPDDETEDFLQLCNYVMTVLLLKRWEWINVPLEIEAEVTPVDGSWHTKKVMAIC